MSANRIEGALSRRSFLTGAGVSLVAAVRVAAQRQNPRAQMTHDSSLVRDSTNFGMMDQSVRSVSLPPKPNAVKQLTNAQRDALEHQLHCQCGGCTLDVFTCRTTDFSCRVSPAMHRDVMALVDGGYGAQEIIDAFVATYGQRALMAPPRSGFNVVAWVTPGIAVLAVGAFLVTVIRRWQAPAGAPVPSSMTGIDATEDELARLDAAIRDDR